MIAHILDGVVVTIASSTDGALEGATFIALTEGQDAAWAAGGQFVVVDGVLVEDSSPLRNDRLRALSARFGEEISKGCISPKGAIQCDDQAQARVNFVISCAEDALAAGQPVPDQVLWTMADRSQVSHTLAELRAARLHMGLGFQAKMAVRQAKEAALRSASDRAAIDAVNIETGWP